jgi:hypothetical protein
MLKCSGGGAKQKPRFCFAILSLKTKRMRSFKRYMVLEPLSLLWNRNQRQDAAPEGFRIAAATRKSCKKRVSDGG